MKTENLPTCVQRLVTVHVVWANMLNLFVADISDLTDAGKQTGDIIVITVISRLFWSCQRSSHWRARNFASERWSGLS